MTARPSTLALLTDLVRFGVQLRVADAGRLRFHPQSLPDSLRDGLRAHKVELIALLSGKPLSAVDSVVPTAPVAYGVDVDSLYELFTERAAIREYDGGVSRATAERDALGELLAIVTTGRNTA